MNKKARPDSVLKTLPADRQGAIAEYALGHTLAETVKWLRADGVHTSSSALSLFLSSYRLSQRLAHNESTVDTLLTKLQGTRPDWTAQQLHEAGQAFFSALAIDAQDADVWTATQRLTLDRDSARTRAEFEREKIDLRRQAEARSQDKLRFEREKWIQESCKKILAAATDAKSREIAELNVSDEEKIKLMRQTWFADVDALEKSGEVKLPE